LLGNNGEDVLTGGEGNDSMTGAIGDDDLSGDNGNDSMFGGNGNDTLEGGNGNDTLRGGFDEDSFVFETNGANGLDGNDTVEDFARAIQPGDSSDLLIIEDAAIAPGSELQGDEAAAYLDGLAGVTVVQAAGNTTITWANGDSIVLQGIADTGVFGPIDSFADLQAFGVNLYVV
jgi:Ca2+-binding RTX toxin-like protein